MKTPTPVLLMMILLLAGLSACSNSPEVATDAPDETPADLGKQLFFDTRLSSTGAMSCESCHLPEKGWTDGQPLSTTFNGTVNTRHTPTLYNVSRYREFYWDGRMATLEAQILAAWRGQMGADPDKVAADLAAIPEYASRFQTLMGGEPTPDRIVSALAAFVRTLESRNSPWDRYEANDRTAVPDDVVAGFQIFSQKANCTLCHLPPDYTDTLYHNVGIGFDKPEPDGGRGAFLTRQLTDASTAEQRAEADKLTGAFKTPTLRSIAETGPYFHDGRAATLEEALDFMLAGGYANPHLDEKLKPVELTPAERDQLLAFLRALSPPASTFQRPTLP